LNANVTARARRLDLEECEDDETEGRRIADRLRRDIELVLTDIAGRRLFIARCSNSRSSVEAQLFYRLIWGVGARCPL
jgi:hypothetical protein